MLKKLNLPYDETNINTHVSKSPAIQSEVPPLFQFAYIPKTSNSPVVHPIVRRAVADHKNSMVKFVSAGGREHPRAVKLERHLVGLDGDRDRSDPRESRHESLVGGVDLGPLLDLRSLDDVAGGGAGSERGPEAGVGVIVFSANAAVVLDPVESLAHVTAEAALIYLVAVDKLLLGELGLVRMDIKKKYGVQCINERVEMLPMRQNSIFPFKETVLVASEVLHMCFGICPL